MEKVKQLMAAGLTASQAIKMSLDMPLTAFADKYDIPRSSLTNHVNATVRASDATVAALAKELGGTEAEWHELLWQAMRPAHLAAS